ncbi:MAG: polysaccharide biosynthesis/export family protein [Phormidesmis sp.]
MKLGVSELRTAGMTGAIALLSLFITDGHVAQAQDAQAQDAQAQSPAQANSLPNLRTTASISPPAQPTQQLPRQQQPEQPQPVSPLRPQPLAPALPYTNNDPLKPGDVVTVNVLGFPNLSGQQQISNTGTVQLPLGGAILVGGASPLEAAPAIEAALLPYVRRPEVSVSLVTASPLRVSVSGEVQEPGPRLLDPSNSESQAQRLPPTLSTALMASGGITPNADLRNIVIRRPVLRNPLTGAIDHQEYRVNLWDVVSQGDLQADPRIFSGDEIIVPTATVASIDQQMLLSSTIAPSEIQIQVAGAVNRPGQLTVSPTVGVSGAVAAAGGLNADGDPEKVVLLRMQPDGSVDELAFTFGEASAPLMSGDVVVVQPSSRGEIGGTFDFLGRILSPFGALFNIFR